MTEFLGMILVGDGYRGTLTWVALCAIPGTDKILAVHPFGWYHSIFGGIQ